MADNREELGLRSIDSILDGHASADPLMDQPVDGAKADPPPEKPAKADSKADAKAKPEPEPKGKGEAKPKADDDEAEAEGTRQAVLAERRRRQEIARERDQLRDELERLRGVQRAPQRPDPKTDPDGARRLAEAEADERAWQREAARSAAILAEVKPDYAEKEAAYIEAMETADPARREQMRIALRSAVDPGLHAYNEGKRILREREIGDPDAYEAKVREKLRAEFMEEFGIDPDEKPKPKVPQSLGRMVSTAPRDSGKTWDGPTPLAKILG